MLVSHKKKFIFIHNYKTGGTSVTAVLFKYTDKAITGINYIDKAIDIFKWAPHLASNRYRKHVRAYEVEQTLQDICQQYFSFGFIRDPWDWQVSQFTFILKDQNHPHHTLVKKLGTFTRYIDWRIHEDLKFQKDFFYRDGELIVDFIGGFEKLHDDFNYICNKIDIMETLPHLNSSRSDTDISKYYTPRMLSLVTEAFQPDIDLFGYEIPKIDLD